MLTNWLVLTATLPTSPSGLRVRVWRSLKATGAGTLREGVYLLPQQAGSAQALRELAATIAAAGAEAHLLQLTSADAAQERSFRALFDRSAPYAELLQAAKQLRAGLRRSPEATVRKALRGLHAQLQALQASDFFPGPAGERAAAALAALNGEVERRFSAGEPAARQALIEPRDVADYQHRTWATRKRPWVDRLATAWLVARFIDRAPRFVWLADPKKCPKSALGFDFDGAAFTHVGDRVTFEVVAESFGLLGDPALERLGRLVHCIDVGGLPVDEAPGFELAIRGLQALHPKDDDLLAAGLALIDAMYVAMKASHDE